MKRFNFAFYTTLFIAINGWVYMEAPRDFLFLSATLSLPLLFVAFGLFKKIEPGRADSAKPGLFEEAFPVYATAMFVCTVLILFIYKKAQPGIFFFAPRIAGWTYVEGLVMFALCSSLGACGIAAWSIHYRHFFAGKAEGKSAPLFLLDIQPAARIIAYFFIIALCHAAAAAVVLAFHPSRTWFGLLIVTGRCMIPLAFVLISAFLRFPIWPFAIVSTGASAWLFALNTNTKEGIIFGIALVAALCISALFIIKSGTNKFMTSIPQSALAEEFTAGDSRQPDENKQEEDNGLS